MSLVEIICSILIILSVAGYFYYIDQFRKEKKIDTEFKNKIEKEKAQSEIRMKEIEKILNSE